MSFEKKIMNNLVIQLLKNQKELPWKLLLLADPSKDSIDKYIHNSDIYIARINGKVVGEYVLLTRSQSTIELMNIAVDEECQGKGIGEQLLLDAIAKAKNKGVKRIEVGTGNSSLVPLALYKKCGFKIVDIEKDYFVKHYSEVIMENGIRCTDMIRLAINF
jgi:ribosomal protein S18 acetylase RimI-like enzyme